MSAIGTAHQGEVIPGKVPSNDPNVVQPWKPDRYKIGKAQLDMLYKKVMEGDEESAVDLVSLASYAVLLLELVWSGHDFRPSPDFERNREIKRDMLRAIASKRERWPIDYHCRKAQRKTMEEMLKGLELGTKTPLKALDVADDYTRLLLDQVLCPSVGFPTAENAKDWVEKAMSEILSSEGLRAALFDPHTWLYRVSNPQRQAERRRNKARKALKAWEVRARREHRSGNLSVEERERKAEKERRIASIRVNDSDIKSGIREAIALRVKSLVR